MGLVVASTALTATAVTVGVAGGDTPAAVQTQASGSSKLSGQTVGSVMLDRIEASRASRVSRTAKRVTLEPQATGHKFATAKLNVWTEPREQGKRVGLVGWGSRLAVTGQVVGHWAEVIVKGDRVRWVNADYLANRKPRPAKPATTRGPKAPNRGSAATTTTSGVSRAPCAAGSATEAGLTANAVALYRAVCGAFPSITSYGGYSPRGEHADGRAVDIMVSGSAGQAVAEWLRANAASLRVRDIIYAQRIWTPDQASAGWRYMSDRGSATANHYDHVHVAVF